MKYDPTEYRLILSPEHKLILLGQLHCCESVREVQREQIQKAADHNTRTSDPRTHRKPVKVFGSPLKSLSAWTGGKSDGLWAATNMGMMGYPIHAVASPEWAYRFTYRGPQKGILQNTDGEVYLPQMNYLGLIGLEGITSPFPAGQRLMAMTFRVVPDTDRWFASLNVSSRPVKPREVL